MSQGKSILKNTLIYAIGNFGSKILAFLLLPLYSFYLTKGEFGTYDLFIVTISLLAPILSLQMSDAVYRWLIEKKHTLKEQSLIITSGLSVITGLTIIFIILFLIFSYKSPFKYSNYFIILLLFNLYLPFFQKVLRGLKMNKEYAISGIINTFFVLTLNIIFLTRLNLNVESLFLASILASLITLLYVLYKIKFFRIIKHLEFNKNMRKEMVKYSLPLVPNSLSWWLINASDKYLILYFISIEANGIYAISTRFPAIIMMLNSIFLMAWQDHGISVKEDKENQKFFSKLFNTFINLELSVVIFLIAISPYLIKYLIDEKFIDAWKYLPLLFIGTAFSAFSAYIGVGYQREKKTKGILITSLIGGLINITISLLLIKHIGLYAPALGTFVSFLVIYILRKRETNHFFRIEVNNYKFIILITISLMYSLLININSLYIRLPLILLSFVLLYYLNKEFIKSILSIAKNKIQKT